MAGNLGILGGGGTIFGMPRSDLGVLGASLKDAVAYFSGRPEAAGSLLPMIQQQADRQQAQELFQAANSPDAATRQKAYAAMPMLGIDPSMFQKQQASQALPQLMSNMLPQLNGNMVQVTPRFATPEQSATAQSVQQTYNPTLTQALDKTGSPELSSQMAPSIISDSLERQAKAVRPATREEKLAAGLSPNTPAQVNAYGQISPISDPFAITPYQQAVLDRQNQADAETRRHNAAQEAAGRDGGGGLFSMIDTPNGMFGVTRGGTVTPMMGPDGKPLVSYHSDVGLRYDMNAAGAGGKSAGTAAEQWPTNEANFSIIGRTINRFYDPKVRAQAGKSVGMGSLLPTVPGVNSDFRSQQKQLEGGAFLQAFNSLRGAGAISEREGTAASAALLRAQNANTPDEFYAALGEFSQTIGAMHHAGKLRAQRGAVLPQMGVQPSPPTKPTTSNW